MKQTVYIPTDPKKELPIDIASYFVIKESNGRSWDDGCWFNGKSFESALVALWLKPIEINILTDSELQEVKDNAVADYINSRTEVNEQ